VRGCLVTGTGTGVGKTVVAAAMVATLRARGESVAAFKPVVTGLDEPPEPGWPPDHELLAAVAGSSPEAVAPLRFGPAVSPHLAAELAGTAIDPAELVAAARRAGEGCDALVVEGVGGVLVPLTTSYSVRDLARDLALGVVVAAAPGLGTINHTLLTLEAIRAVGLDARGVVLTPWPAHPGGVERSNADTIAQLGSVEVTTLDRLERPERHALAAAGAGLPLERWLSPRVR
jgi:dethiobiotin synthetase